MFIGAVGYFSMRFLLWWQSRTETSSLIFVYYLVTKKFECMVADVDVSLLLMPAADS